MPHSSPLSKEYPWAFRFDLARCGLNWAGDTHICRHLINYHHHFLKLVPHLMYHFLFFFLFFFSNFVVIRFCRFGIGFWLTLAFYLLYVRLWVADRTIYSELFSVTFFCCNLVHWLEWAIRDKLVDQLLNACNAWQSSHYLQRGMGISKLSECFRVGT